MNREVRGKVDIEEKKGANGGGGESKLDEGGENANREGELILDNSRKRSKGPRRKRILEKSFGKKYANCKGEGGTATGKKTLSEGGGNRKEENKGLRTHREERPLPMEGDRARRERKRAGVRQIREGEGGDSGRGGNGESGARGLKERAWEGERRTKDREANRGSICGNRGNPLSSAMKRKKSREFQTSFGVIQ